MLKGRVCSCWNVTGVIDLAAYITDVSLNYAQVIKVEQEVFKSQRQLSLNLEHPKNMALCFQLLKRPVGVSLYLDLQITLVLIQYVDY